MDGQNITLSLPKDILQKIKVLAAQRGTSVSGILTGLLVDLVRQEEQYELARQKCLARLDQKFDLGTAGRPLAVREALHER